VPCGPAVAMRERCDGVFNVHVAELVDARFARGEPVWVHVLFQGEQGRVVYRLRAPISARGEVGASETAVLTDLASLGLPSPAEIGAL
jgi:hypothetical protein